MSIVGIVLFVPVESVERRDVHSSNIVRVHVALHQLGLNVLAGVRREAPFQELNTSMIFNEGRVQSISHSHSLLFSVFDRPSFVPIPRDEVRVDCMTTIGHTNDDDPHTERTITVESIFLEISVHFVVNFVKNDIL